MRCKHISAVLGTAVLASISAFGVASPASADPGAGTYPAIAGTGSDTTQEVLNALAAGSLTDVGSYDATGTPTIQVSATGNAFNRPVGSGNGIKALSRSIDGAPYVSLPAAGVDISGQLSFARSSRGPKAGTDLGSGLGDLTFIPFARDGVAYAANGAGLGGLTVAQLNKIYTAATAADAVVGTVQTTPILPQAGSGTRAFFLGAIGVTEAQVGAFVSQTGVVENQTDGVVDSIGEIVPFSAASWVAQSNGVAPSHITTAVAVGTTLGSSVADDLGTPVPATLGVAPSVTPNPDYYVSAFGRDVYNVVQTSRLTSGLPADAALVAQLAGPTAAIASAASDTIVQNYGFLDVAYAGDTDIVGSGDIAGDNAKGGALE